MEKQKTYGLSLHGLKACVFLGIRDHEKKTPQPIEMDVDLQVLQPDRFEEGDVSKAIPSYSTIRTLLIERAQAGHRGLLESLALELMTMCLALPGVEAVRLKVAKPMALKSGVASVVFEGVRRDGEGK